MQNDITMPFGKYEGKRLTDVPRPYLIWLKDREITDWLRAHIVSVLTGKPVETDDDRVNRIVRPWKPSPGEPPPY